jgi:hypothetical protein
LTREKSRFVKALLGIAASGIENARSHDVAQRLNLALDQKVQELAALLDLVRGLRLDAPSPMTLPASLVAPRWRAAGLSGDMLFRHGRPGTRQCAATKASSYRSSKCISTSYDRYRTASSSRSFPTAS